jgi:acetyl esterase/lipase
VRPPPPELVRYGPDPEQVANVHLPALDGGPWPAVVVVHGGYWRDRFDRAGTAPLANDLAARGYLAWNVEYRRVGRDGGGWPGTLEDVAAAADALPGRPDVDPERVVVLGHSAGGQLALWLAARARRGSPLRPAAAVSLAGLADLARAHAAGLGSGACSEFLGGGPEEFPERYAYASPAALLPLGVPQLLVHGAKDEHVPVDQSRGYARAARDAGDEVELVELADADHFDVIDVGHAAWAAVVERLPRLLSA